MAIANIQVAPGGDSVNSVSLVLDTGSGTNRLVVACISQKRTPPNVTSATFDGIAGTQAVVYSGDPAAWIFYWLDADLPASAGTYTLACDGSTTILSISGFSCSGAAQSVPSDTDSIFSTVNNQSLAMTLPSGAVAIACGLYGAASTVTPYAGQTAILVPTIDGTSRQHYAYYDTTDGTIGVTHASNYNVMVGAVFDAAGSDPTLTDVDTDETIVPGQTGVVATGTNLSDGASARWVDANANVLTMTNYSAHATAPTFDVPNLATTLAAGVKFGSGDFEIWSA